MSELPSHLEQNTLTAYRLEKLHKWVESGKPAYPSKFDRTHLAAELQAKYHDLPPGETTEDEVRVAGRVQLLRSFGQLIFAPITDRSGQIQLFANAGKMTPTQFQQFEQLDVGDWVGASGKIMTTKRGELSVAVNDWELLAKGLRPLPEKWQGLADIETRSRRRYLDLIMSEESRRTAIGRSKIINLLRHQFLQRDFLEVETPILQNLAGGALARPFETHHRALDLPLYLRIATELHLKRLVVGGLERVFEIGRIFRNEGIDATHNPEFTMLESYQALADYQDVAEMTENVIRAVVEGYTGQTQLIFGGELLDFGRPFDRVGHQQLASEILGEEASFETPLEQARELARKKGIDPEPAWGLGKIFTELVDNRMESIRQPTFVFDYPRETSPLAKPHPDDPNLVERFELHIGGMELANAYSELNDPLEQRARFQAQAEAKRRGDLESHPIDEDYLLALEYGMPPTGGLGIGVDRLVMLLTGQTHQREVILFPTLRPEVRADTSPST